jgi:hypothetical protein
MSACIAFGTRPTDSLPHAVTAATPGLRHEGDARVRLEIEREQLRTRVQGKTSGNSVRGIAFEILGVARD